MCLVEVEKQPKLQPACQMVGTEGMVVKTSSPKLNPCSPMACLCGASDRPGRSDSTRNADRPDEPLPVRTEAVPLTLDYARTRPTERADPAWAWTADRLAAACARLGTGLERHDGEGRLTATWPPAAQGPPG